MFHIAQNTEGIAIETAVVTVGMGVGVVGDQEIGHRTFLTEKSRMQTGMPPHTEHRCRNLLLVQNFQNISCALKRAVVKSQIESFFRKKFRYGGITARC